MNEKYILRVYNINMFENKINIKKFFNKFGLIKKYEKIILKNKTFEIIMKIKINNNNQKKLYSIKNLYFKYEFKKYLKNDKNLINKKVFINNLPKNISKTDIFLSFKHFGKIEKILIFKNNKNNNNFAFLYFNNKISSFNLLKEFSSHYINDIYVNIKIKKNNINKKIKKANKQMKFNQNNLIDDCIINNNLTVYKWINQKRRSNSLKNLSYKNEYISKNTLKINNFESGKNTKILKNKLIDELINNF